MTVDLFPNQMVVLGSIGSVFCMGVYHFSVKLELILSGAGSYQYLAAYLPSKSVKSLTLLHIHLSIFPSILYYT